jgi:CHASE3 domain sensor protein|tara:strand:- start:1254 stop:1730 length:477 start_codon:yes stop_codon:yes gene_type:complete
LIEISLAVAAAEKAFQLIKYGVDKSKEIHEMQGTIAAFYDAKDKVTEAKAQSENTSAANKMFAKDSVESYALQAVLAEERTKKLEAQLKRMFQDKGKTALYSQMMRVRQLERSRRLQAAKAAAKRKKRIADLTFLLVITAVGVGAIALMIGFVVTKIS